MKKLLFFFLFFCSYKSDAQVISGELTAKGNMYEWEEEASQKEIIGKREPNVRPL